MSGDAIWSALVPALLDIEGIPRVDFLDNVEAPYIATALLPVVRQIVAEELRAAADDFKMPRNGRNVCLRRADALDHQ